MRPKAPKIGNMNECIFHTIPGVQGGVKFKPIDEFPGYWIGEDGTVVSTRRGDPHVLKVDYNADGYVRVRLFNRLGRYNYFVHRLVAEAFIPKREGDKIVDHLDTNVENNNASNLRWCRDMKENMANPLSVAKRQRAAANRCSRAAKRKAYMEEIMRQAMMDTPF